VTSLAANGQWRRSRNREFYRTMERADRVCSLITAAMEGHMKKLAWLTEEVDTCATHLILNQDRHQTAGEAAAKDRHKPAGEAAVIDRHKTVGKAAATVSCVCLGGSSNGEPEREAG